MAHFGTRNALKLTGNADIEKMLPGEDPRIPRFKVEGERKRGGEEMIGAE